MQTDYTKISFIDYMNAMDDYAKKTYLIDSSDLGIDEAEMAAAQENGESPESYVDYKAEKYGVESVSTLKADWRL
jgi:hypothetical protein